MRTSLLPVSGLLSFALALGAGCSDESLSPLPVASGEGGAPVSPPTVELPGPNPVVKRTVIERNPFGDVAATQNLLWDGDFEWTSPFADEYGWWQLPSSATVEEVVIGPTCKSGVKCARLKKNGSLLGIGVGAAGKPLFASVAVKFEPPEGEASPTCDKAELTIMDFGGPGASDPDADVPPVAAAPDADGWCTLAGTIPGRANKPYFLLGNHSGVPMIVDDGVLLVSEEPSMLPPQHAAHAGAVQPALLPPSAAQAPRLAEARAAIARLRLPHDAPPGRAERELAARKKGDRSR